MSAGTLRDTQPVLVPESLAELYRARWLLRARPLDMAVATMLGAVSGRSTSTATLIEAVARATTTTLTRMRPTRTTCMVRAMVRCAMLRRRGVDAVYVMGVRQGEADIEGHAWVELGGVPIMEDELPVFTPTLRFPRSAP